MDCIDKEKLNIIKKVNMLWMQHSEWTFMAIESIVLDCPNKESVIDRLLRNPKDFAIFLRQFYGDLFAYKFDVLFTEHLTLAADWINATIINDTDNANIIRDRWYRNAEEISSLLASVNPYWSFEIWRDMFFTHLGLVEKMTLQIMTGNYKESIETYDIFEAELMMMADIMYNGILRQFYY